MLLHTLLTPRSHNKNYKRVLTPALLLCLNAQANEAISKDDVERAVTKAISTASSTTANDYSYVVPENEDLLRGMDGLTISQQVEDVMSEAMLSEFGFDNYSSGYIFVSSSMPDSLIRAYSVEAQNYGFSLVFIGTENESDLMQGVRELADRFHTSQSNMALEIDPRLFDVFEIDIVPTIVLTDIKPHSICNEFLPSVHRYDGAEIDHTVCKPATPDQYCKLSGAVHVGWALDYMFQHGCEIPFSLGENPSGDGPEVVALEEDQWKEYRNQAVQITQDSVYNEVLMKTLEDPGFK